MSTKIVFSEDQELSYDGINVKTYKAGETYEAKHAQEARVFDSFIASGRATQPKKTAKVVEKQKVVKPKSKKRK